jgi:hypothetical protein
MSAPWLRRLVAVDYTVSRQSVAVAYTAIHYPPALASIIRTYIAEQRTFFVPTGADYRNLPALYAYPIALA